MARMKECELDYDELEIKGCYLNVRLIAEYQMDGDGVNYFTITSGDCWSERRSQFVELSQFMLDEIQNKHYMKLDSDILAQEVDRETYWNEREEMRREFERTEVAALKARYNV